MQRPKVSNPGLKFKKDGVISHSIPNFWGWGGGGVKLVSCTVFHSNKNCLGSFQVQWNNNYNTENEKISIKRLIKNLYHKKQTK